MQALVYAIDSKEISVCIAINGLKGYFSILDGFEKLKLLIKYYELNIKLSNLAKGFIRNNKLVLLGIFD